MQWNLSTFKAHLRSTSQIFGQSQAKSDYQSNISRADIATLLRTHDIYVAREKAEKLLQDELFTDLLGEMEAHLGVVMDRVQELQPGTAPSPALVEAAATIIYATPYVHSKELDEIRNYLVYCLGPSFARSAATNRDHHVSRRVLKSIPIRIPSAFELDIFLKNIAAAHEVEWQPEPHRQDLVDAFSVILNPADSSITVDLAHVRKLSCRGLPDNPAWLRPRLWKLLLGVLPAAKADWQKELIKQREAYYDLTRRLLVPFTEAPYLSTSSSPSDTILLNAWKQLSSLPSHLFILLEEEPGSPDLDNPDQQRAPITEVLNSRLSLLQSSAREVHLSPTPEIRLDTDSLSVNVNGHDPDSEPIKTPTSTTLVSSRKYVFGSAHPKHCSALLRLLFLHSTINPGNLSPHMASLLVPLYSAMIQDVELEHAEADTFWMFEALVAELSGLEDESGTVWMKKLAERLQWADFEFFADLEAKGLDPSLPHYSYLWMMPLLTHTLPLSSMFVLWDAIFACGLRNRESNPKLDRLVDICTAMLVRMKRKLSRVHNVNGRSLWGDEPGVGPSDGSLTPTTSNFFMEGVSLLQQYDLKAVGGIDRISQTAVDFDYRRQREMVGTERSGALALGARLTGNVWKGLMGRGTTNNTVVEEVDEDSLDEDTELTEHENDTIKGPSLTSKITDAVWKGITNQSAMDVPPSPTVEPLPLKQDRRPISEASYLTPSDSKSSPMWEYAGKLKASNPLKSWSKASSWRASTMLGTWGKGNGTPELHEKPLPPLGGGGQGKDLPPPPGAPGESPGSTFLERTKTVLSAGRSSPSTSPSPAISPRPSPRAPRPLLLGSAPIVTPKRASSPLSTSSTTMPENPEWAEVMRMKRQHFHKDSHSSVSSLSPSDAFRAPKSAKSDWESDTSSSRIIALNRRSVSPMAPNFRIGPGHTKVSSRTSSVSSGVTSPLSHSKSPTPSKLEAILPEILQDSPTITRLSPGSRSNSLTVEDSENSDLTTGEQLGSVRKPSITPNGSSTESGVPISAPTRMPRVRSKRQPRPANLQIVDQPKLRISPDQKAQSPSSLAVEWPADDVETLLTPKASSFEGDERTPAKSPRRVRKVSTGDRKGSSDSFHHDRPRKVSNGARVRKVSVESREQARNKRESAAEEGDDEGYDDLLSAYESEDTQGRVLSH